jgi:hypothetical protein
MAEKRTMPFAQYAQQAQHGAELMAKWHARLPPHEDVEDSCLFTITEDTYNCAQSGCPGWTPGGLTRCSCIKNCGAEGCCGWTWVERRE